MSQVEPTVIEITDEQRTKLIAFFAEHPDTGYKVAVRAVGQATNDERLARATKAEAEQIVKGDDDVADAVLKALKIDRPTLLKTIGEMAADADHRDRFRATTFALAAVHGLHDQVSSVEVTGAGGKPLEVQVDHDYGRLIDKLADVGLLRRSGEASDAEEQRLLPPPAD